MNKKLILQVLFFSSLVGLTACSETSYRPSPERIYPDSGCNDRATPVEITGKNFMAQIKEDLSNNEKPEVAELFKAVLKHTENGAESSLENIVFINSKTFTADVSMGLEMGWYDLIVTNPNGEAGTLPNAFYVTDVCNISRVGPTTGCSGDGITISGTAFGATTGSVSFDGVTATITSWSGTSIVVSAPGGNYIELTVTPTPHNNTLPCPCSLVGTYSYDGVAPTGLAASPPAGAYCSPGTSVTLSCDDPEATIYYTLDDTEPTTGSSVYVGPISISVDTTLKAIGEDECGNLSGIMTELYTIDTEPPDIAITSPIDGETLCTSTVVISGSCVDAGFGIDKCVIEVDGVTGDMVDGKEPFAGLLTGVYAATLTGVDLCGNGATTVISFSVDVDAPEVPTITAPVDGSTVCSSAVVTDISCAEGSCEERLDGGIWQPCGTGFTFVADGPHTIEATCTDTCGNTSFMATSTFRVDTQVVVPTITAPAAGSTVCSSAVVTDISCAEGSCDERLDGGAWQTCGIGFSGVTPGPGHLLEATCTDACSNTSFMATSSFGVDAQAPEVPTITAPAAGSTVGSSTIVTDIICAEGSCEERLDGGVWQACGIGFSGVTSGPDHLLEARCTDACDNVSLVATSSFGVDAQIPWITFTWPGNGQTGLPTGVNIEIQFSEDMDKVSVESGFSLSNGGPQSGAFYWVSNDRVIFVTPGLLADNTSYTVDLAGATDLAGNPSGFFSFNFTTGDCTPPQVTSKNPDGTTLVDSSSLTQITISFNEPMDTARGQMEIEDAFENTVVNAGIGGPGLGGTLTWTTDTLTLTLSTPSIQEGSAYRIEVWDLGDQNGNQIWGDIRWGFVTQGPVGDTAPPQIMLSLPFEGQTGVPRELYNFAKNGMVVFFNEPLDPATLDTSNITLSSGSPVPITIIWNVGDDPPGLFMLGISPPLPLSVLETYTLSLGSGIKDSVGNSFVGQDIVFTTADEPDDVTSPLVEATLPGDGWIDLDWWGIDGKIGFNEPIDYSTVDISALTLKETNTGIPIKGLEFGKPDDEEPTTWELDLYSTRAFPGMKPDTQYTLTISSGSISDISGNPLADYSWTFTTVPEGPFTGQPDNRLPRIGDVWPDVNAMSFENGNVSIMLGISARDDDGDPLTVWVEDADANTWTLTEDFPGSGWFRYETPVVSDDLHLSNETAITYEGWQTYTFYIDDGQPGHTISVSNQVYIWPTADLLSQVSPINGEAVTAGGPTTLIWQKVDTTNAVVLAGQYSNAWTEEEGIFFTFPTFTQTTLTGLSPGTYVWMVMQMAEVHGEIFEAGGVGVGYQGRLVSHFNVLDPTLGSISGAITYAGASTGTILVAACTTITGDPVAFTAISDPGDYTLYNLPDGTYYLLSLMDVNGNMEIDLGEPFGVYDVLPPLGEPDPVTISGGTNKTGINIDLPIGSISGAITYAGTSMGEILVAAVTVSGDPIGFAAIPGPGTYIIYNLPDDTYYLGAYMDVNGNEQPSSGEPSGMYGAPDPVTISSGTKNRTGIGITLTDP